MSELRFCGQAQMILNDSHLFKLAALGCKSLTDDYGVSSALHAYFVVAVILDIRSRRPVPVP